MEKMISPVSVAYVGDFKLLIRFDNDELRVADLSFLQSKDLKTFHEIKNEDYFRNFTLDEFGAINWPNGYDFAPDTLYEISVPVRVVKNKNRKPHKII